MAKKATIAEFIEKAVRVHGNKYDYSKSVYENSQKKLVIVCPEHGAFEQKPNSHLNGRGCPSCGLESKVAGRKRTTEGFAAEAVRIHNGFYDYSKSVYTNAKEKLIIICPEHGEFRQQAEMHLKGQGCPKCKGGKIRAQRAKTAGQFVEDARRVHGDRYDYSKTVYVNNTAKLEIVCPGHGMFTQSASHHLNGQGCPKCAKIRVAEAHTQSAEELKKRCIDAHGSRYDYRKADFGKGSNHKITVICPTHGEFSQSVVQHYSGQGCPRCARMKLGNSVRSNTDDFVSKSVAVHGKKYNYRYVDYCHSKVPVEIMCKYHGQFYQQPNNHLGGHGCPVCGRAIRGKSRSSDAVLDYIRQYCPDLQREVRIGEQPDDPRWRADGFIPSLNLYIEYNGLRWHSTRFNRDKYQHLKRLKLAEKYGKRILFIHEDEWWHRNSAVKNLLRHVAGGSRRLYGRNCKVEPVAPADAVRFYEQYHIQGCHVRPEITYGLLHQGELVACMSFSTKTSNRKNPYGSGLWELVRFASNESVTGGAGKLFKHFVRRHRPAEIVSFSWNHLFTGNLYEVLGFTKEADLNVDYSYVDETAVKRYHKTNFQHSRLKERFQDYDPNLTEEQNCRRNNWFRIYDCGKKRWRWRADEN